MGFFTVYILMATVTASVLCLERWRPASVTQQGEWLNNATAFLLITISQGLVTGVWATSETRLINGLGGGLIDLRGLPWFVGGAIYLITMDLGEYAFHRAQHAFPWMWAMHSLHHGDRALNVTSTNRHFWLEPMIKTFTIWLAPALLFKVSPAMLALYFVAGFNNFLTHANLRVGLGGLSWLWNSPQYHRLHHSVEERHHNANYAALLPIFDVVTGAYRRPAPHEFPDTGLDDYAKNPFELMVWPLRRVFRRAESPG